LSVCHFTRFFQQKLRRISTRKSEVPFPKCPPSVADQMSFTTDMHKGDDKKYDFPSSLEPLKLP